MLNLLKKYSFLLGLLILLTILLKIDFTKLIGVVWKIKPLPLILGLLLTFPILFIKSWRWNYLKSKQLIFYRLKESFLIYCASLVFGIITPGNVGEVIKIYYLKKDGYSYSVSLVSVVWDRLIDIIILAILAVLSAIIFFPLFFKGAFWLYLIVFVVIIFLLLFLKKQLLLKMLKKIFYVIIPSKFLISWKIGFDNFLLEMKKYKFSTYFWAGIISFIAWLIYFIQIYLFSLSLNIEIPVLYFIAATAITILISVLPISFIGLGLREASYIILLSQFSISPESLIALSQLFVVDYILIGIVGAIILTFKPVPLSLKKQAS